MNTEGVQGGPCRELTQRRLGTDIRVSKWIGAAFLKKVYENALVIELQHRGLTSSQQVPVRVQYRGHTVSEYVAEVVVEHAVLVEVKAAEEDHPLHVA